MRISLWILVGSISILGHPSSLVGQEAPPKGILDVVFTDRDAGGPLANVTGLVVGEERVWLLDSWASQVVGISLAGDSPVRLGRRGSGPGEFQEPVVLQRPAADALWIWDARLRRATLLSTRDGGVSSVPPLRASVPGLSLYQVLPLGGRYAAVFNTSMSPLNQPAGGQGSQGVLAWVHVEEPVPFDTLATFPLSQAATFVVPWPDRPGGQRIWVAPPFSDVAPNPDFSPACGGVLVLATGGRDFEVQAFDTRGRRIGVLRQPVEGQEVLDEEWGAYLERIREPELRRLLGGQGPPARHAPIQDLRVSSAGHLWVRSSFRPSESGEMLWHRWTLESDGDRLHFRSPRTLLLPERFTLWDEEDGRLWGIHLGEFDEPSVRAYRPPWPLGAGCSGG